MRATACAARCCDSRDKAASVFLGAPLGNRTLVNRIKFALKFRGHQLEPLAQCGIDHRSGQAFGAGDFGKGHIDVRHDFHKCGALAPRNRSANQNAQIATKERTKIPPHARKVDVMTSSESGLSFEARPYVGARNSRWSQRPVFSDFIGSTSATSFWCTCSHTEHSNVHRSKPDTPKLMRVSIKSDRHFGQGGCGIRVMMLAQDQAGARHSQSPVEAETGGDRAIMSLGFRSRWSILLTMPGILLEHWRAGAIIFIREADRAEAYSAMRQ